jgi:dolichol-phosphate mannosyltransferase
LVGIALHSKPTIAVVIPVFNEVPVLPELFRRLEAAFASVPDVNWNAIFVNDGSRDQTRELIAAQIDRDSRFRLLDFSRNFGHQAALTAGSRRQRRRPGPAQRCARAAAPKHARRQRLRGRAPA